MPDILTVYVHGAGSQENRQILKRRLDGHLFGSNQLERTRLAYYADLSYAEPAIPSVFESARPAKANELEAIFDAHADAVAEAEMADVPAVFEGVRFPDPAFRSLAAIASKDVTAYLYGGMKESMRQPLRDLLRQTAGELVVIAHSLGSIVTFDVLSEPEFMTLDVQLLVTAGSPLGIDNVREQLAGGGGPPVAIPPPVKRWENFADRGDPVAVEHTLSDEFEPIGMIVDHSVNNRALLSHDLTGYLDLDALKTAVRSVWG